MMTAKMTKQQKRDRMDLASLVISAASLGVGIAALCLNEKKEGEVERMVNKVDSTKYTNRKDLKKAYAKEIKRAAVSDIGYTGTVIVLNEKGEQTSYGLVPLDGFVNGNRKIVSNNGASNNGKPKKSNNTKSKSTRSGGSQKTSKSWVAMEMNTRTGGSRQAIVCTSKDEARSRALAMKNAHRSATVAKECKQGYALMDTSKTINVFEWFSGNAGTIYTV